MRPASSCPATAWISALCLLTVTFGLSAVAPAQSGKKRLSRAPVAAAPASTVARSASARPSAPPATGDTWTGAGGDSNWSDSSNWNNGAITTGENITINLTTAATTVDQNYNIGTLTLSNAGDSVTSTGANFTVNGNIVNNGTINLLANSYGAQGILSIGSNLTLSGTGAIVIGNETTQNFIAGTTGVTLTNSSTIEGGDIASTGGFAGIGNGQIIVNNTSTGIINANQSGDGLLYVNPLGSGTNTNTGLMEATNGGELVLSGSSWTNTGGTITAGTGSFVDLQSGVSVTGGTLSTSGTGIIQQNNGGTVALSNVTLKGVYDIQAAGGNTDISGTITNNGTINLQANNYGAQGILYLTGNTTLAGTGTVVIGNETTQNFFSGATGAVLTNNSTIVGGVVSGGFAGIGNGQIVVVNNGTIDANMNGGFLNLNPQSSGANTNNATLEATNGGTLQLSGATWTNTNGTITAANNSFVQVYNGLNITGGTLSTSGSGMIEQSNGGTVTLNSLTNAGAYLVTNGQTTIAGTINNTGTMTFDATDYGIQGVLYLNGNATLKGSGSLVLANTTTQNYIGGSNTATFTNQSTITGGATNGGYAAVGNGQITLVNSGTINGNISGTQLNVNPLTSTTSTNTGTIEATNGGAIGLSGTWTNTGGTITAANTSFVNVYDGLNITGGTLSTSGSGLIEQANGGTVTLNSLTLNGAYDIQLGGGTLDISGTITNNGSINLLANSYGAQGILYVNGTATLAGTGALVIGNETTQNYITGSNGAVLTNNSTIEGGVVPSNGGYAGVGNGQIGLINNGTINANVANGGALIVNPTNSTTSTNTGTMEATNGGVLQLSGGTWTNTGTITAATGSSVQLNSGVTINGGTLSSSGTGVIETANGQTVTLNGVTNSGTYDVLDNSKTQISGTITNNGTINVQSAGSWTMLYLTGNTTLNGKGAVVLGAGNPNFFQGVSGAVLTNASTIEGTGYIGWNDITITNNGTFMANNSGGTLSILPGSGGFTNYSGTTTTLTGGTYIANPGTISYNFGNATGITTLAASVTEEGGGQFINTYNNGTANALANLTSITSKGALTIGGVAFTDAGAFSNAGSLTLLSGESFSVGSLTQISGSTLTAGTYVLDANLNLTGATENITTNSANLTLGGGTIENANSTNALSGLATNTKSLTLANSASFTTAGNFSNTGTLTVNSGSTFTVKGNLTQYSGSTNTLKGGTFVVGGTLALAAGANGIETDSSNLTMEGTGTIKNTTKGANANGLLNFNTISSTGAFTLASNANFTTAANFTNSGKLTINSGSKFSVTGTLTNLASGTLTGGTYTISGTLQLASANGGITTNASTLTLTGAAAKINDGTANALSSFNNNTGSLTLSSAAALTTASSAFTNSGTITVSKGTTLTVGGTNNTYTQTAGTTTVDGSLKDSGTGGLSVTGGTLQGAGTVTANVSVGGSGTTPTINVGDAGKAGLLSITGTYTQLSTGTMNVSVGGTTVGTQYSQLKVTGTASLGGTLTAGLVSGFTPKIGQTFTVLTASSVSGTFSNSTIAINSSEHFAISYTATGVELTVVSGPVSASGNSSAQPTVLAAALKPVNKGTVVLASNNLRHPIFGIGRFVTGRGVEEAGLSRGNMPAGTAVSSQASRLWERVPAAPSWDHLKPVTVAQVPQAVQVGGSHSDLAHRVSNWTGVSHTTHLQAPLAHRIPMQTLPAMRMGR